MVLRRSAAICVSLLVMLGSVVALAASPAGAAANPAVTSAPGSYHLVTPTRTFAKTMGAQQTLALPVDGVAGVPSSNVSAVVVTVTASSASKAGYLIGWADGTPRVHASVLNFAAGQSIANQVVLPVGADGNVALFNGGLSNVGVTADVFGYYLGGTATEAGTFVPVTPNRVLNTASGVGVPAGAVPAGGRIAPVVLGTPGVPTSDVASVVVNVTAGPAAKAGSVVAWNGTLPQPAPIMSYPAGKATSNEVVLPVSSNGKVAFVNSGAGSVQLTGDIVGYYRSGSAATEGSIGSVTPPVRALDTRSTAKVAATKSVDLQVTARAGVPRVGVIAVLVNVTALSGAASGYLIGWNAGATRPHASIMNFAGGANTADQVLLPVSPGGKISLFNGSGSPIDLIVDVSGYVLSGAAASGVGNDVSWPQCGGALPSGQAFAVVGLNHGRPTDTNDCLATQVAWARTSSGGTSQPILALAANTANPGTASTTWPTSNDYPAGVAVANPYGSCTGAGNAACAYIYGYSKAYQDVHDRGVTASTASLWWLDIEGGPDGNSWDTGIPARNVADLEGMTRYLTSQGITVGIYSLRSDWSAIAGTVAATSILSTLPNWLPIGPATLAQAQAACAAAPLMHGTVTKIQYVVGSYDYDYACH